MTKATKTFHLRNKSQDTIDIHLHIGRTRTGTRVTLEYDVPKMVKIVHPVDPDKQRAHEMFEKGFTSYRVSMELARPYSTVQYWREKWAAAQTSIPLSEEAGLP